MRLSQCMIVKNEEKNIEKALSWGKEIMWEQIVVDTGSTDRTVELAEAMGAKIYHFPWIGDFSAAKNYAIEHAQGDWIAFLDADEYVSNQDAKNLWEVLNRIQGLPLIQRPDLVRSTLISLDDNGKPIQRIKQDRVFRNQKSLRYKNRIHEVLSLPEEDDRELIYYDMEDKMTIFHTGYSESVSQDKNKIERNLDLLRKAAKEFPSDTKVQLDLATSLSANGFNEEAVVIFEKLYEDGILDLPKVYGNKILYYLMMLTIEGEEPDIVSKVESFYQTGMAYDPDYPEYDFMMGWMHSQRGNWELTISHYELSISKLEAYKGDSIVNMLTKLTNVYQALTVSAYNLNDLNRVVRYGVLCLKREKFTVDVLQILLHTFHQALPQESSAMETMKILQSIYDFSALKDRVFVWKSSWGIQFFSLNRLLEEKMSKEEVDILQSE